MDIKKQIEKWFPKMVGKNFNFYEPDNKFDFNCLSFSLDMDTWIWTNENWPKDIPNNLGILSFKLLFEQKGYRNCDNSNYEDGYEKIAIYSKDGNTPSHVSKQTSGIWKSKTGKYIIEHELEWLSGNSSDTYGDVVIIMKKLKNN